MRASAASCAGRPGIVQLGSERARQPLRQDRSFAREAGVFAPEVLLIVLGGRVRHPNGHARCSSDTGWGAGASQALQVPLSAAGRPGELALEDVSLAEDLLLEENLHDRCVAVRVLEGTDGD
jgi:hypothetical protein